MTTLPVLQTLVAASGVLLTGAVGIFGLLAARDPYRRLRQAAEIHSTLPEFLTDLWSVVVLEEMMDAVSNQRRHRAWRYAFAALESVAVACVIASFLVSGAWIMWLSGTGVVLGAAAMAAILLGSRVSREGEARMKKVADRMERLIHRERGSNDTRPRA